MTTGPGVISAQRQTVVVPAEDKSGPVQQANRENLLHYALRVLPL